MRLSYVFLVLIGVVIWAITSEAADFRDQKGVRWFVAKGADLPTHSYYVAQQACDEYGGSRLPWKREFEAVRADLLKALGPELKDRAFWLGDGPEGQPDMKFVFYGNDGSIDEDQPIHVNLMRDFSGSALCISAP